MEGDTKPCPVCGEAIKTVALKCRFCNTDLTAYAASKEYEVEQDLFSGNPAVIYSVGQFVPFLMAFLLAVLVVYFRSDSGRDIFYTLVAFVLVCGGVCLWYLLKSRGRHFHITTQRIKVERGLLSKVQESLELFRIDHFELRKSLGMRLLGNATLHLFSSDAELGNFYLYGIPNLEALADTLRNCQLRERTRRGLATFLKA